MKLNSIVTRYALREFLGPGAVSLVFFIFIFLMAKILDITNLIVNYNINLTTILRMLLYSMPSFLEFVLPMTVMMAVLLSIMRMSTDNEIIALKSGGVGIAHLLPAVLLFCLIGSAATFFITLFADHWGRQALRELTYEVMTRNLDVGLKERTFNDAFKDAMFYVSEIDTRSKKLRDVFIEDRRDPARVSSVVAPEGVLFRHPGSGTFVLRLYRGTVSQVEFQNRSAQTIHFETYDVPLDLEKGATSARPLRKKDKEMSLGELSAFIDTSKKKSAAYYSALLRYHRKFSIPLACFAMGILAVPLGITPGRTAQRSLGMGAALFFFLLYYMLLSAAFVFGEAGVYPPRIGVWVPNLITGAIGIYLLRQASRERPVIPRALQSWAHRLQPILDRFTG